MEKVEFIWLFIQQHPLRVLIGGVTILLLTFAGVIYKGMRNLSPKVLPGIPHPPISNQIIGHPEEILHPMKHELRSQVGESMRCPYFQLIFLSHVSVFVNDAAKAKTHLEQMETKGPIYSSFKLEDGSMDLFTMDGDLHKRRRKFLSPSLNSLAQSVYAKDVDDLCRRLCDMMHTFSESGKPFNALEYFSAFLIDVLCVSLCGVELGFLNVIHAALSSSNSECENSQENSKYEIFLAMKTLCKSSLSQNFYDFEGVENISAEEISTSKQIWKDFLNHIWAICSVECENYRNSHGNLEVDNIYVHALKNLEDSKECSRIDILGELHQYFMHGHSCILSLLLWSLYGISHNPKSKHLMENLTGDKFNLYLSCSIMETLRRYPIAGNATIRTTQKSEVENVPSDTPLHIPLYSFHTSSSCWNSPKDFCPSRWLELKASTSSLTGLFCDFQDPEAFFPFALGQRSCLGKKFSLFTSFKILSCLLKSFKFDLVNRQMEEDIGISLQWTVLPFNKNSYTYSLWVRNNSVPENTSDCDWKDDRILFDDKCWASEE